MKKLIKIAVQLLVGILISTGASAYYTSGGVVYDGGGAAATGTYTYGAYEGYLGNLNLGLPVPATMDPWIGTHALATAPNDLGNPGTYVANPSAILPSSGSIAVHWYKFSVDVPSLTDARYEWDGGITSFKVDFFLEGGSDTSVIHKEFDSNFLAGNGHFIDSLFYNFLPGEWLMRIEGQGTLNGANGYRVRLVPLPPAVLLFISALAGFGVIGRKRGRKVAS